MKNLDTRGKSASGSAEATRMALIMAGLSLFGRKGFDATSTRQIAAAANANIGSIAYHFGGKDGLREACARHVVDTIRAVAGPAVGSDDPARLSPQEAQARLEQGVDRMVRFIVGSPQAGEFVQFVLRELSVPGSAIDILYGGVFEPVHRRLCQLWERATGDPAESERTRIAVFTMIGQVVYFRIGREAVLRRMGWAAVGTEEAGKLAGVALDNLKAALAARREGNP
jgi:AcrR family transcriptional regulator